MPNISNEPSKGMKSGMNKAILDARLVGQEQAPEAVIRNNDADDGVTAFGLWLTQGHDAPISVREFVPDHLAVLYDNTLLKQVSVVFTGGVPSCKDCADSNDCIHVGFAICLEQQYLHPS